MLLLFQAAAQQIPPIQVTVQQPPGLPFWETAVISAVVGTFFGIASGTLMEFVKPLIARRHLKRVMLRHLDQEFRQNYRSYLDAVQIAEHYNLDYAPDFDRSTRCHG